jgi:hypothetical protein
MTTRTCTDDISNVSNSLINLPDTVLQHIFLWIDPVQITTLCTINHLVKQAVLGKQDWVYRDIKVRLKNLTSLLKKNEENIDGKPPTDELKEENIDGKPPTDEIYWQKIITSMTELLVEEKTEENSLDVWLAHSHHIRAMLNIIEKRLLFKQPELAMKQILNLHHQGVACYPVLFFSHLPTRFATTEWLLRAINLGNIFSVESILQNPEYQDKYRNDIAVVGNILEAAIHSGSVKIVKKVLFELRLQLDHELTPSCELLSKAVNTGNPTILEALHQEFPRLMPNDILLVEAVYSKNPEMIQTVYKLFSDLKPNELLLPSAVLSGNPKVLITVHQLFPSLRPDSNLLLQAIQSDNPEMLQTVHQLFSHLPYDRYVLDQARTKANQSENPQMAVTAHHLLPLISDDSVISNAVINKSCCMIL